MLTQGSTVETMNLIVSSFTAPPPVLTPNSIFPPLSPHCAFILASREIMGAIQKSILIFRF
jgi:hypothetical protein